MIQFVTPCVVSAQVNRTKSGEHTQDTPAGGGLGAYQFSEDRRLTTTNTGLRFAVFASSDRARAAQVEVAGFDDVELLTTTTDLRSDAVANELPLARLALLLGASLVVGFVIVGIGMLVLMAAEAMPNPIPTAYLTTGVAVVLAAGLGGLAGALIYAGRSRTAMTRLRGLLDHGHAVLLFRGQGDCDEILRQRGAVQIGSLT